MKTTEFKENVDSWIKEINSKVTIVSEIDNNVAENGSNIEHNYELIYEMKDQIEELKQEIRKLKLIQLYTLKKQVPALKH